MKAIDKVPARDVTVQAPPAKAYTLRALLLAALADGVSHVKRPLMAEDQINMIGCLRGLGIRIDEAPGELTIYGNGGRFKPVNEKLFVGDSGVTMNFLSSAACFVDKAVRIEGTPRLNERPIKEVVDGVRQLGAKIDYLGQEGFPPILVHPTGLIGGRAAIHGAVTSQYFSSLVISSALARGPVRLECLDSMTERPYFDISTSMMKEFGVRASNTDYKNIEIPAPQSYGARTLAVEGDYSSASFLFLVAAVLGSKVRVEGLNPNSVQGDKRFLNLIERMGCTIAWGADAVEVSGGELRAIEEDMSDVPDLVPPLAVAAAFAQGTSRFTRIGHLVHKESNRIVAVENELRKMGIQADHDDDSMTITGNRARIHGATIATYKDHRIAMSFAVAGLATGNQLIENPDCVAKSFPDFWDKLKSFQ